MVVELETFRMNEDLLIQEQRKGLANTDNQDSLNPGVM